MRRLLAALILLVLAGIAATAVAQQIQETPEEERSLFLRFVEDQLSAPNREIRITGIQGVLSSNARIGSITVADNEGVWLRITNAAIVWSRSALVFSQRLQIDTLTAERIEVVRQPVPDESLPTPEATGFSLPELPIAVNLDALEVARVSFGEEVFGLGSEISVAGRIRLEDGSLDTALTIDRLDGPAGRFELAATYANETQQLDLDLNLAEAEDGIVANLLSIEGRPPVTLVIEGSGVVDEFDATLALDADSERVLSGTTALRRVSGGLGYTVDLDGSVASLIPVQYRGFFGAETTIDSTGTVRDAGGIEIENLALDSAALTVQAAAETTPDGFLRRLSLDATLDDGSPDPIVLPVPGGDTTLRSGALQLSFGEAADDRWSGSLDITDFATPQFTASDTSLTFGGTAANLDRPVDRQVTFAVDGEVAGIVATRADIAQALGEQLRLAIEGSWAAGQPIDLARAALDGNALSVLLQGQIADYAFTGDMAVKADSVAPFSGLAGRDLSGAIELAADGTVRPLSGAFDLTIDSAARDLAIGIEAADNLLAGATTITGRVARGEDGLAADGLRVGNDRVELTADGSFATGAADFDYALDLSDLSLLTPDASGRLTAQGRAAGADGLLTLTTVAAIPEGSLVGRRLSEGRIAFEGTLEDGALDGTLGGDAFLDGVRAQLSAGIAIADGARRLSDLTFSAGGASLRGSLEQDQAGLIDGQLTVDAADIATAAALFLVEASGAVDATVELARDGEQQSATAQGSARNLRFGDSALGEATFDLRASDLFGVPAVDGTVRGSDATAGGVDIAQFEASASTTGRSTAFDASAALANGAEATAAGALEPEGEGFRLRLDQASLGQGVVSARLTEPASLLVVGDTIAIDSFVADVGGGRVSASGSVASTLDLAVNVSRLPLSIANLVRPDLGLAGTIDADATIAGTRDAPEARFTLAGRGIAANVLRQAGQQTIDIDANGSSTGSRLTLDARATSPQGLRASLRGGVPLDGGQLALDVSLDAFPLAALDAVARGQNLGGTIAGTARVSGTLQQPEARFDVTGRALSAAPLRNFGIAALEARAAGTFAGETVTLSTLTVGGPQGLSITASGAIPLSGSGLSLNASGNAPLALADAMLIDRGTQLSGVVQFSGSVSGSLSQPAIRAMFSTSGAQAVDPETNIRLTGINVMASMDGDTVTVRSAGASLAGGGSISASGTISTREGLPANLSIALDNARYADRDLVVATVSGTLSVTGPLTRDPLIAGNIAVDRAEISVPENLAGGAAAIDVKHLNPPPSVEATLRRARANDGTPTPSARPSVARLNVTVSAPNRIFVRGRGLDAELGGQVTLTGPITAIQPVGGFQLVRGRLSILGQRITFDEGTVTLVGDLDPYLNFVARSQGSDIIVFITVTGRISDIQVAFSSQPELPEDEVLARLVFNRGLNELSPLQIAQLAAAAAELAGGGTSLLGSLRQATGLDDIDVVTDSEGNPAVRAGRYIQDNIYLGVEAGTEGTTRGSINLDITDELKARGSVGSNGDSSLGIFYERDY
jgi:translocation and assembly module TamB